MKNKIFSRSVRFRDAEQKAWTVEFELRSTDCERRNRFTLENYHETLEASFCGNGPNSCGQIDGHIKPRTDGQRKLLDLWNRYHLCGMNGGTDKQEEYLCGPQYKADYDKFVETFSGYDKDFRKRFDDVSWRLLHSIFQYDIMTEPWVRKVVDDMMSGNPVLYILGDGEKKRFYNDTHNHTDYYVRCLFLAMKGLYSDRGYCYGKGWLHEPLPKDMQQIINNLFDEIEAEEAELTESLNPVFDMAAENFKATTEIINKVMELRGCTKREAERFIALGMHLGYTFGDLDATFEVSDERRNLYEADGTEYYLGTYDELEEVAQDYMDDGCYDDVWREAVRTRETEMGLKEWCKWVLDCDGWANILNSWNGSYDEYQVGSKEICVSRT